MERGTDDSRKANRVEERPKYRTLATWLKIGLKNKDHGGNKFQVSRNLSVSRQGLTLKALPVSADEFASAGPPQYSRTQCLLD